MILDIQFRMAMAPLIAYCNDELAPQQFAIYQAGLTDLTLEELVAAVSLYMLTSHEKWFPSIGQLRSLAEEHRAGRRLSWDEAWGLIMVAAEQWSPVDKQKAIEARDSLSPELHKYLKQLGGFYVLGQCDLKTLSVKQALFKQTYEANQRKAIRQARLPSKQALATLITKAAENLGEQIQTLTEPIPKPQGETPDDSSDSATDVF